MPEHRLTPPPAGPDYPAADLRRPGGRGHAAGSNGPSKDATADVAERQKRGTRPDPTGRPPADSPPS